METKSIQVKIDNTEYSLKSDMDEAYVKMVADYVDKRLRHLTENTNVKSATKIAVLTALNIADELFRLRENYQNLQKTVELQSKEISESVDHFLNQFSENSK